MPSKYTPTGKPRGRPKLADADRGQTVTISMTAEIYAACTRLGDGSASTGGRLAMLDSLRRGILSRNRPPKQ